MRKILWTTLILALAGGAGFGLWRMQMSEGAAQAAPASEAVIRGTFRKTVLATGVIEAASLVSVGAQVGGQIQSLPVELGQKLAAGDLVAQIDPEDQKTDQLRAQASLAQIRAQIAAQEASIEEARLALERQRELSSRKLATAQTLEASEAQFKVAEANLAALKASESQAELAVQAANIALERTRITAPSDGTVVALVAREGQTINANQSSPTLIKLADLDRMIIKVDISEADVIAVQPGQKASFTLSGAPDMRFDAVLRDIEPAPASIATADEVDTSSAIYYRAILEVPNPKGILRIGMTAEVVIVMEEIPDALIVPTAAVISGRSSGKKVRVLDPTSGAVEIRDVETGAATASQTVIVTGISEGERIVTAPSGAMSRGAGQSGSQPGQAGRTQGATHRPSGGLF
ncbi:efflux RND transporter periplasmic adaptor subunit [Rhodobacter sp. 24-YEA-8]|uniref:efflux RND transporter periplasmic adaptor subunit n=1 Tax=Rhodobacter sp. 24-YEA-8 TaxID=1884310 RepID=UPI000898AB5E|nr:efflux RND transporter periplasmic adaptor subunit [Rhodobacter sp. 24-YEA-8]SEC05964.1 membrane fusion protein, macrolide-specific efflux system [Rhodobacter sp. 24-YEA-8]